MKSKQMKIGSLIKKLKMLPLWLRGIYYKRHFDLCGKHLFVTKGFDFNKNKANVLVGDNVRLYSNVKISALGIGGAKIILQNYE